MNDVLYRFATTDTVREARIGDDIEIARLYCLLVAHEDKRELSREDIRRVVDLIDSWITDPDIRIFVLERSGQVIGQVMCRPISAGALEDAAALSVWGLYVDPTERCVGSAIPLVRACVEYARSIGAVRCEIIVVEDRRSGFYERIGCKPRETVYTYEVRL